MSLSLVFLQLFAYLCGSIPFGLIISKVVKNIDIREHGSHSIGATNAARTLGKKWGAVVLLLDGLKAIFPLLIAKHIFGNNQEILAMTVFFAVIGHIFPIWLKFKGGKGFACILFSYFFLDYRFGLILLGVWIVVFLISKMSSLSTMSAMLAISLFSYFISIPYFILSLILSFIVFYRHKDNIKRILKGEELAFKK
jgi:glycerol-3-phosphate acyltransferase PlsY